MSGMMGLLVNMYVWNSSYLVFQANQSQFLETTLKANIQILYEASASKLASMSRQT